LFDTEDLDVHYKLGKAIGQLRRQGVAVVGGGMSVHNMMDLKRSRMVGKRPEADYAEEFHGKLAQVLTMAPGVERAEKLKQLMSTDIARKAHPTFEHFMPLAVVLGAAEGEKGDVVFEYVDDETQGMGYMCVEFGM